MKHIVLFSGGIGSFCAAKRLTETIPIDDIVLLFTDTLIEDPDLYRFIHEASTHLGIELQTISDGRTPWEVFKDARFLGNSRIDVCSRVLKREQSEKWIKSQYQPNECIIYLGIDWTEEHRYQRAAKRWLPYILKAPMCDAPWLLKAQMIESLEQCSIKPPRLYELGFAHNNCGGFCVKAGQAHFKHLLEVMPDVYAKHEAEEQQLRDHLGKDIAVMRYRSGAKLNQPYSMAQFRDDHTTGQLKIDLLDIGGCGCYTDVSEDE